MNAPPFSEFWLENDHVSSGYCVAERMRRSARNREVQNLYTDACDLATRLEPTFEEGVALAGGVYKPGAVYAGRYHVLRKKRQ